MMRKGDWSGGFTNGDGNSTYPYKVDSGQPRNVHELRAGNVHDGEANDSRNYEQ